GHHRTSLAHAAYLIRHESYSAEQAWHIVSSLPWSRPTAPADRIDKALIEEFARVQPSIRRRAKKATREVHDDEEERRAPDHRGDHAFGRGDCDSDAGPGRLGPGQLQLRRGPARPNLSVRTDAGCVAGADRARQWHQDRFELAW